jgi:DNA-directed RNA polymerase specialized sigma subunit
MKPTYTIAGEKLSIEQVIAKYGHEVLAVVRRVKNSLNGRNDVDYDRLRAEGYAAMVKATPAFDETRGMPFSTYARLAIEKKLKNVLRECLPAGTVRPEK